MVNCDIFVIETVENTIHSRRLLTLDSSISAISIISSNILNVNKRVPGESVIIPCVTGW